MKLRLNVRQEGLMTAIEELATIGKNGVRVLSREPRVMLLNDEDTKPIETMTLGELLYHVLFGPGQLAS